MSHHTTTLYELRSYSCLGFTHATPEQSIELLGESGYSVIEVSDSRTIIRAGLDWGYSLLLVAASEATRLGNTGDSVHSCYCIEGVHVSHHSTLPARAIWAAANCELFLSARELSPRGRGNARRTATVRHDKELSLRNTLNLLKSPRFVAS